MSLKLAVLRLCALAASAQQAIVNMPSADITPKGKFFAMHETQWRQWNPGTYWYGTNFFCYGVGKSTELTLTNWNSGTPATANFSTGVGFKSSPQLWSRSRPEREYKLTVGQKLVLNHRGQGVGSFSYSHWSFRVPRFNTRLTAGAWAGTRQLFKRNTADVLAGIEQPLAGGKYVLVSEWFRGSHDLGFLISGLLYHPVKSQIIVVAYKVPNRLSNGRHGVVLEYGLFW